MAKGRLSMRKTKEILRLKFDQKISNRKIAKSCGTSHSVVADYLCRAKKAGLGWLHIAKMNDAEIEAKLFPNKAKEAKSGRGMPVMEEIHIDFLCV